VRLGGGRTVSWGGGNVTLDFRSFPGNCAALSPDGRLLAAGVSGAFDAPSSVQVYDADTWKLEATLPQQASQVASLDFSPDASLLAAACWGGKEADQSQLAGGVVYVWDVATARCVAKLRHAEAAYAVVFGPDGSWLASGHQNNAAAVWDLPSGKRRYDLKDGGGRTLAVSRDGKWLACSTSYFENSKMHFSVMLCSLATGERVADLPCSGEPNAVAFTPDGDRIVAGCDDGLVLFWDLASRQRVLSLREPSAVTALAFSKDGLLMTMGCRDGRITTIEADPPSSEVGFIETVPIGPAGTFTFVSPFFASRPAVGRLAISTEAGTGVWEVPSGRQIFFTGSDRHSPIALDPKGALLAICSSTKGRGLVRVWDVNLGRTSWELPQAAGLNCPCGVAFVDEGRLLAVCEVGRVMQSGRVRLYDASSGALVREFPFEGGGGGPLVSSPDGALLAVCSDRVAGPLPPPQEGWVGVPCVRIFDVTAGKQLCWIACQNWDRGPQFNADGSRVVEGLYDGASIYDSHSGKELFHVRDVGSVAYDGQRLVTASRERDLRLHDPATGAIVQGFGHGSSVGGIGGITTEAVALSGDLLVVGPNQGPFYVFTMSRLLVGNELPAAGSATPHPSSAPAPATAGHAGLPLVLIPGEICDWAAAQSASQLKVSATNLPAKIAIRERALSMAQQEGNAKVIPAITNDLDDLRLRLRAVQAMQAQTDDGADAPAGAAASRP
jgi:WD40 repeat protein